MVYNIQIPSYSLGLCPSCNRYINTITIGVGSRIFFRFQTKPPNLLDPLHQATLSHSVSCLNFLLNWFSPRSASWPPLAYQLLLQTYILFHKMVQAAPSRMSRPVWTVYFKCVRVKDVIKLFWKSSSKMANRYHSKTNILSPWKSEPSWLLHNFECLRGFCTLQR
jgi:hypothetical protein